MERAQKNIIINDLAKKIVILVGPRQAGKTWLAKDIAQDFQKPTYLNYDHSHDRSIIHAQSWSDKTDLLILDELHKLPEWKNYLKGIYDTKPSHLKILVTGSARLETYDRVGDSLAGRYFKHRLMPLSLAELYQTKTEGNLNQLMERGGFPEPFFSKNLNEAKRWRQQYLISMLSTDVFDVDVIQNLKGLNLLVRMLRERVGSPISYQSLSEDVAISPTTVKKYIQILESLFIIFSITPYSKNIARSLLKEPKIYFYDSGLVLGDEGAIFENTVAISLLKHTQGLNDGLGEDYALHYLRTKEGHEVDFTLTKNQEIESFIEVKLFDKKPSNSLRYFKKKYGFKALQIVKNLRNSFTDENIDFEHAETFLKNLYL